MIAFHAKSVVYDEHKHLVENKTLLDNYKSRFILRDNQSGVYHPTVTGLSFITLTLLRQVKALEMKLR